MVGQRTMRMVFVAVLFAAAGLIGTDFSGASSAAVLAFGQPQAGPGRTGSVYGAGVVPPLTKAFSFTSGTGQPFVPIDDGRAFTFADPGGAYSGSNSVLQLDAINLSGGTVAWTQGVGAQSPDADQIVADGGHVFTAVQGFQAPNSAVQATVVSAYNESNGAVLWRETLDEQGQPFSMIAANGTLFLTSSGSGGTVWALNESTGARRWTTMTWDVAALTLESSRLLWCNSLASDFSDLSSG